jgi:hypothetical protein
MEIAMADRSNVVKKEQVADLQRGAIGRFYSLYPPEEGLKLMRAFVRIEDQSLRKAFISLLSVLAGQENSTPFSDQTNPAQSTLN